MSTVYDKLSKLVADKQEMIEQFVRCYGEEYREKITQRLNEMKIVFIASDLPKFRIKELMIKKYKNDTTVNIEEKVNTLFTLLDNIANDIDLVVPQILVQEKDVLAKVGINVNEIVKKDKETGVEEIVESEETKKLKNLIKADKNKKDVKDITFELDDFRKYYTNLAMAKECADNDVPNAKRCYENLKNNKFYQISYKIHIKPIQDTRLGQFEALSNPTFAQMKNDLTEEEKIFMQDFLSVKGPSQLWKEEFSEYVIKNINSIFNKNFQNIKEMNNDTSMKTFLDLKERASRVKGKWIKRSNNKFYENIKVFANQNVNVDDMLDSGNTMAAYTSDKDMVKIPLDENTSYSVIMHEVNHGLSRWKKTETIKFPSVGTEPSTIEVYMAAFNTLDEMDEKEDLNTTTFNEIVNEYLTQEVMKEVTKEEMNNKPVFKNKECNYTSGVNIMKPFLDKYKKVLIQSQVNRGDMIKVTDYSKHPPVKEIKNGENPLMKFIGKQNYKFLLIYTKVLGLCNYGKFLKAQKGENKKEIAEVADWIKDYKKDPKQALDNLDTNIENMGIFVSFEKFLNDLVANYEKFENNQIKTINPMSIDDVKKDFKNRTQDTSLSN